MCLICIDLQRGAMKLHEARRALGEMRASLSPQHLQEVEELIEEADKNGSGTNGSKRS
jgi:hypothetical protein